MERLEYTEIIVEKKPPLGYITINRPEKRNAVAITPTGTVPQIAQAAIDMREDPKIRCFIIRGAGDCFCAGFDMGQYDKGLFLPAEDLPEAVQWVKGLEMEPWAWGRGFGPDGWAKPEARSLGDRTLFWEELWENPTPSICQVHSFCLGAGLWIANQCDIVYAEPNAVFAYPPIRYGASIVFHILPPWLLGRRKVLDMALTGRFITAQEAYDCQLITEIVPEDEINERVKDQAMRIATVPPVTNMLSKRAINNYFENLGITETSRFASAMVAMTEASAAPGHYIDFFRNLVFKKGFTEAYKEQREKWGWPDPVLDGEVARLKAKKGK